MIETWIIVGAILLVCSLSWFGYMHAQDPMDGELIPLAFFMTFFVSALWPAILILLILSSPFLLGMLVGKRKVEK